MGLPELPEIEVRIDEVVYLAGVKTPPERPHPFAYFITILNHGPQVATVRGRKWVLYETGGDCLVVEGDGVVGQTPEIAPGESFAYNSCHTVASDAEVQGAYLLELQDGTTGCARIPTFYLKIPDGDEG